MRTPSLLSQCLPGLLPQDKASHCVNIVPERDLNNPSPAVEIVPAKNVHPYKYAGENVEMHGLNIFKGKVSVADLVGISKSDAVTLKSEGTLKSWESSIDLVNVLKNEIRDGLLSFRGKRILELGCGYGLPGIFACIKGASTVHFQDPSAETIRCKTVPNVLANLEQARDRQCRQPPESPLTPSRNQLPSEVRFFAGDWDELHTVLSVVPADGLDASPGITLGFCDDDLMDNCSSQDGSVIGTGQEMMVGSARRSRKLSGSRAWERGNETGAGDGGYDIVLINEIPYSANSLQSLYSLIKKCLRPPYAIVYLAAKKNYIGSSTAVRQLRALVDEEGTFGAHLVSESNDREIWKFFFK
ncbi:hypothetical protein LUZ61_016936 [Rhynchospora tenuis]|uniref:Histidine protein methyltransferase 1 homolog n=1 Tax=Rhynchospora tenuis TaxID=198213 RepID=A0AAD5Z6F7_9POAL|nr:hypothetical protein LUZ61_016936 [Rhynchospora tenuis]